MIPDRCRAFRQERIIHVAVDDAPRVRLRCFARPVYHYWHSNLIVSKVAAMPLIVFRAR